VKSTTRFLATSACALLVPSAASAFGGLELSPGGSRALGRGGAVVARADDPYALIHNPAGLSVIRGDQLLLNVDVPFHKMCVTPIGYYGWGVYESGESDFGDSGEVELDADGEPIVSATYATDPLDRVCNSATVLATPNIAYNMRFGEDLGIAFGMLSPTAVAGLQYGGEDGTINTPDGARPTPTRYQLVKQEVKFALAPTVGIGYRVMPRLSLGFTFQWVAAEVEQTIVQARNAGTSPHPDALVKLRAKDYFIPGATLGILATPIDPLDIGFAFRVYDGFGGSGDLRYTTATYQQGATSGFEPYVNPPIGVTDIETSVPWSMTLAVRYAHPLAAPVAGELPKRGDPLATELFDVELDLGYQFNARASESSINIGAGELIFSDVDGNSEFLEVPDQDEFDVDRHLRDAATIRLGGTYNIVPRYLGVSAGTFYESRGVDPDYANIDSFAFARFGLGVGLIARVYDWDFGVAYGHVFQETLVVGAPPHEPVEDAVEGDPSSGFDKGVGRTATDPGYVLEEQNPPKNPDGTAKLEQSVLYPTGAPKRVVNAGTYEASFHILAVSVSYRF
jgi:long-subunit fatty acid transport protein